MGIPGLIRTGLAAFVLMATTATGAPDERLRPCPESPNCVSSLADDPGHSIPPITYTGDPHTAWITIRAVLLAQQRSVLVDDAADYLHAEVRSLIFRFVDDVELLHRPEQRLIHVRSASRTGYGDFGVNRRRVENLRTAFQDQLAN